MKILRTWVLGVLAGISIALGGTIFLSLENRVLGAMMFTVGLFSVCTCGFSLYTGKVCYVLDRDREYALMLPVIWLGNLCGSWLTAWLESLTRVGPSLAEHAAGLCAVKLGDTPLSIFVLAFFCNVLIHLAVDGYARIPNDVGKMLALFFGVMVFILCGFEHCVANMYYFSMAGAWSGKTVLYLLIMTAGNSLGGIAVPLLRKIAAEQKA